MREKNFLEMVKSAGKNQGFAKSRACGLWPSSLFHSSHPVVQFRILVSILQCMFWSVFQNGRRWVLISLRFQLFQCHGPPGHGPALSKTPKIILTANLFALYTLHLPPHSLAPLMKSLIMYLHSISLSAVFSIREFSCQQPNRFGCHTWHNNVKLLYPVQRIDDAIHQINHCLVGSILFCQPL